jgi:hypothetical protein
MDAFARARGRREQATVSVALQPTLRSVHIFTVRHDSATDVKACAVRHAYYLYQRVQTPICQALQQRAVSYRRPQDTNSTRVPSRQSVRSSSTSPLIRTACSTSRRELTILGFLDSDVDLYSRSDQLEPGAAPCRCRTPTWPSCAGLHADLTEVDAMVSVNLVLLAQIVDFLECTYAGCG